MDFYVVLGLPRDASLTDVKRAYRRLARKYHPDINPGDRLAAAEFRRIAQAYETLIDPDRRRQYDTGGSQPVDEPVAFEFEGFDFSVRVGGPMASTFGDLFGDAIVSRQERRAEYRVPQRGADLYQVLTLTFDEAMRGGLRRLTVTRQEVCRACRGAGAVEGTESRCLHCDGTGIVKSSRGHMVFSRPCQQCEGTGLRSRTRCGNCGGRRTETRTETITVNVPSGLGDGAQIRVPGMGDAGLDGGEHGDLYVTARVEPHPFFRRDGDDLHVVVPIAIHEAALGGKLEVPALEGHATLRVPPGTQSGQRFRLRERGVPSSSGRRGDLVVEVRLTLPRALDERSKELLREFGRIHGDSVRNES